MMEKETEFLNALDEGDMETVSKMIDTCGPLLAQNSDILHKITFRGNLDVFRRLIRFETFDLQQQEWGIVTGSICGGHKDIVRYLVYDLKMEANTLIQVAAYYGKLELIQYLHEVCKTIFVKGNFIFGPFFNCLVQGIFHVLIMPRGINSIENFLPDETLNFLIKCEPSVNNSEPSPGD